MPDLLVEYYRCQEDLALDRTIPLSGDHGFFRLGDTICYGQCSGDTPAQSTRTRLYDCAKNITTRDGLQLPFDPVQVIDNLRMERYASPEAESRWRTLVKDLIHHAYYLIRPALSVPVRKRIQRLYFRAKYRSPFPNWPVDSTVDDLTQKLLRLRMLSEGAQSVPFIWFWPHGMSSAAIMTHDVETRQGRDFCHTLMDINDAHGIKSSFQLIPEVRYSVAQSLLDSIRARGFEANVHDLNHDGHLFRDHDEFLRRAAKINEYLKAFGAQGFRSGVMYRNQEWFDALAASYDMSVPNAAHLDPQGGGCCTVMPYFVGKVLELPVTTTQDYPLFNILEDYSIDPWRLQIELIRERHGLISFIVHPDYVMERRARAVYVELLEHLRAIRAEGTVWFALPGEINEWWRQRSQMKLVRNGSGWKIEGPGKERACLAYAHADGDRVLYSVDGVLDETNAMARSS